MIMPSLLARAERACQRRASRWFGRRLVTIRPDRAIVSFTFDDFPRSALINAGAILERHGAAGTYYVSLGLAGRTTECGEMYRIDDLAHLLAQGHELGCHTFGHCPAWETAPARFESEVMRNATVLRENLPNARFATLSYPITQPRPETKERMAKHFMCCRGGGQTYNSGMVDANSLTAFFIEQSRDRPEVIRRTILENRAAGGWLILATHDVCASPTRFGCTPELFQDIVQFAVDCGSEIMPVSTAWARIQRRV